jgi:lipopolysaccharide export system permease protein
MAAAGVGLYNLLPLIGGVAALGLVLEGALTLWLEPAGEARLAKATASFQQQALTSVVRAGQFNEFPGGRVLFFQKRDGDGRMQEVFFHDPEPQTAVTVTARHGELAQGEDGDVEAVFFDGVRYQGRLEAPLVRVMAFDRYRVRKSLGEVDDGSGGREALPTPVLWERVREGGEGALDDRVELFRRLTIPLSVPVLLLLALPLGVENRRSGTRSYGILWGALLVLAYHNGLIVLEDWAGNGVVPAHWLLWAAPLPLLALALYLLYRAVHGLPMVPGRGLLGRRGVVAGGGEGGA